MSNSISLATLIAELRRELAEAMEAGASETLQFELGSIDLELDVAVERSGGPNAKVKFLVLELGGDVKLNSKASQRIKLSLVPRHRARPNQSPVIAGEKALGER